MSSLFTLNKIKKATNSFVDLFYDIKHFGLKIAYYNFIAKFSKLPIFPKSFKHKIQEKKSDLIYKFLNTKYANFIDNYRKKPLEPGENCKKIRACWRQGENNAPDLVKICLNSIKKNKGDYELVIIDQNNFSEYINIPDFILQKVKKNDISLTHLSDIIRMGILKNHGGIRVDATMFFSKNVFQDFDNKNLNSNYPEKHIKENHEFTKRTGFFIGGKSNRTFSFVYDFFLQYHKDYRKLIDFFLIDYALYLAYTNFVDSKKDIDQITLKNNEIFSFVQVFNQPYNEQIYQNIIEKGFSKLTYKMEFFTHKDGQLTNYGKFIQENF